MLWKKPDISDLVDEESNGSIEEHSTDYKTNDEVGLHDESTEKYECELLRGSDEKSKEVLIELLDMYPEYALEDIADLLDYLLVNRWTW